MKIDENWNSAFSDTMSVYLTYAASENLVL